MWKATLVGAIIEGVTISVVDIPTQSFGAVGWLRPFMLVICSYAGGIYGW
jgi:hypothetical protein